jgi:serine phosphatase RsbU (regulator of sigma subunit)
LKQFLKILYKNAIYFLLLGIIGIFVFILMDLNKTVDHLSKDMVEKSLLRTDLELENFFAPLKEDMLITAQEHSVQPYDYQNYVHLNAEFRPLVEHKRQLSSVLMATSEGDEFLILDLDTAWMFRMTHKGSKDSLSDQLFWSDEEEIEPHFRNKKDILYDPRERPWYQSAMAHDEMHINWTKPYTFSTTKEPGITISTRWEDEDSNQVVAAFDVLLNDISKFTTEMEISEKGFVFVLTDDERVIGLPAHSEFDSPEAMRDNVLKTYLELGNEPLEKTVSIWNDLEDKDSCFTFASGGEDWWGSIEEYKISDEDKLLVGVAVPERDFVGSVIHSENIIIIGFVLVLFFTIYILRAYREKHKSNDLLRSQKAEIQEKNGLLKNANEEILLAKHEIEEQNHEILDSINYAKRIQTAILPPDSYWNEKLPKSFVLYLPKDIVAGDFYWMDVVDNEVLFAAADCTGHGVPGAMVSVVCHNALNRVVREFGMHQPAEILDKVTDLVIRTFERSDHEVKDGMDISLVGLTMDTMQLEYAGANNPLWIIRRGNGDFEGLELKLELEGYSLYELKADKQPVGKFEFREKFTYHKIKVQKGDKIYLSSDGFPDQFGGERGKKLKSKAFKNLLLKISAEPIHSQREILKKEFEDWMGEFEQLDDVCVIGVEV